MRITIDLPGPPEVTVKALDDAAALLLRVAGMKRNGKPLDGCIMLKTRQGVIIKYEVGDARVK